MSCFVLSYSFPLTFCTRWIQKYLISSSSAPVIYVILKTGFKAVFVSLCVLQLRGGPRGRDAAVCRASPRWTVRGRRRGPSAGDWEQAVRTKLETWTSAGARSSASPTTSGKNKKNHTSTSENTGWMELFYGQNGVLISLTSCLWVENWCFSCHKICLIWKKS